MPRPAVVGVDGGVGPAALVDLGVRDEALAVEDAHRLRREVEGGALPVADDVGLLDEHVADVVLLAVGHECRDGGRVGVIRGRVVEAGKPGGQVQCDGGAQGVLLV